jgi:hypothetical protein
VLQWYWLKFWHPTGRHVAPPLGCNSVTLNVEVARTVDCVWNVMTHAQKADFVFQRNGRVHLNRQGRQFSRLLAGELCTSACRFVLFVQACVLQSCDGYWLPIPFSCFPFTSPAVCYRVPWHFKRTLPPNVRGTRRSYTASQPKKSALWVCLLYFVKYLPGRKVFLFKLTSWMRLCFFLSSKKCLYDVPFLKWYLHFMLNVTSRLCWVYRCMEGN